MALSLERQEVDKLKGRVGFKVIEIFKDQTLGIGSYGKVCKAKCDDLVCAAKLMHETLFNHAERYQISPQREHRLPIRRFEQECEFLGTIRHPNIIQYLGVHQDPDNGLPVLLMELMDDNLTHYLESSPEPNPYHTQVNICHDITLALSFLHYNNIVHRDLSSNNILLIANVRAKVTDFGMAKLGDLNPPTSQSLTFTLCPGTNVYMPPEAVRSPPVYNEKIDCFSFGVITIQILTQRFPKPGDRLKEVAISDHRFPSGTIEVRVSELERRHNHISEVDPTHPLLPIALDCLNDKPCLRPSAQQLCERISALKQSLEYNKSVTAPQESVKITRELLHTQQNQDLQQIIQSKDLEILEEVEELRQQLEQATGQLSEKSKIIQEKEYQLEHVSQQLTMSEQMISQHKRQIEELKQQLSQSHLNAQRPGGGDDRVEQDVSFTSWRRGKGSPRQISRGSHAVMSSDAVCFLPGISNDLYTYSITSNSWSRLPDCPNLDSSLVVVTGLLTAIGGYQAGIGFSNSLFSLTGEPNCRKWTEEFEPMPTKRSLSMVLVTGENLIVAGGEGGDLVATVEVMNTETYQWSTAANLPEPMCDASVAVCGDRVYMLGGIDKHRKSTNSVYVSSLTTLLQSSKLTKDCTTPSVWRRVADLPVIFSTCASIHGRLLAIGGKTSGDKRTTAIYVYQKFTNSWGVLTHISIARSSCFAAVLPDSQIVVVGGFTSGLTDLTDTIEIGTTNTNCIE